MGPSSSMRTFALKNIRSLLGQYLSSRARQNLHPLSPRAIYGMYGGSLYPITIVRFTGTSEAIYHARGLLCYPYRGCHSHIPPRSHRSFTSTRAVVALPHPPGKVQRSDVPASSSNRFPAKRLSRCQRWWNAQELYKYHIPPSILPGYLYSYCTSSGL